jgi:hypothetical protein
VAELEPGQQELLQLLSASSQDILIFDYTTSEAYQLLDIWVEVYQKGELVDVPFGFGIGLLSEQGERPRGRVALAINQKPFYHWFITVSSGDGGYASSYSAEGVAVDTDLARSYGPMGSPATIEDGQEIILYRSIFSEGSIIFFDTEELQERPELLDVYPYVHLVKCKFSKESPTTDTSTLDI